MDFLYLGALGSIQGAKEIGFHSLFGHAGRFLFWFFLREECSLLAYLLVGSTPEQETRSVPRIPAAEQNGFIDPKHNCLPHAKGWVLDLPAKQKQHLRGISIRVHYIRKPPLLISEPKQISPHWTLRDSFPIISLQIYIYIYIYIYIFFFCLHNLHHFILQARSSPNFYFTKKFLENC